MFLALVPLIMGLVGSGMQAYGQQQQAAAARQVAAYNAGMDEAEAKQVDLDSQENIRQTRKAGQIYLSRQQAAYAAAGVTNTGSALSVMATTAGRYEQQAQQQFRNASAQQNKYHAQAQMGLYNGKIQSDALKLQSYATILSGVAKAAGSYGSGVDSGAFSFASG